MDIRSQLFSSASNAMHNAYAPYSKFKVGAAIYSNKQQIYSGCNVENISFPCGTCAEAGAISSMIANGETNIIEMLITADSQDLITPCGACLQRIAEFSTTNTLIHLANTDGIQKTLSIQELLPHNFTAKELK